MKTSSGTGKSSVAPACVRAPLALVATTAVAAANAGPPQRIIVKYRSSMTTAAAATAARDMSDSSARYGVGMRMVRRMQSGANVMSLDRELTEQDYTQLVADVAKGSNVEYAE